MRSLPTAFRNPAVVTLIAVGLSAPGCVRAGFTSDRPGTRSDGDLAVGDAIGDSGWEVVTVVPTYPKHGASWNDYVVNDGSDVHSASDTACTGSEVGLHTACIHGGEKRKVVIQSESSCAGLKLTEDVPLFLWGCRDNGGQGPVTFLTARLAPGKGLKDVIDASGFRLNAVVVKRGATTVARSNRAVWGWNNTVTPLPDNSSPNTGVVTLDQPGTIYHAAISRDTNGYNINADRVAVVSLHGAVLSFGDGTLETCSSATGETTEPDRICLLAAGGQRFLWIETDLDAGSSTPVGHLILLHKTTFSHVRDGSLNGSADHGIAIQGASAANLLLHLKVTNAGASGINVNGSDYNTLEQILSSGNKRGVQLESSDRCILRHIDILASGSYGLRFYSSSSNRVEHIVTVGNMENGISIDEDSLYNIITHVVTSQNQGPVAWDGRGIMFYDRSSHNTVTNVLSVGNKSAGLFLQNDAHRNTFSHVTAVNGANHGCAFMNVSHGTVVQLLAVNNALGGLNSSSGGGYHLFAQIYSTHNGSYAVGLGNSTDSRCTGHLWVGPTASDRCYVGGGSQPGLINQTCTDTGVEGSSTYAGQLSDAVLHVGRDLTSSFVGKVTSDDKANLSDSSGAAGCDSISDWMHFDNAYRCWGLDGPGFPDPGNRGHFTADAGDACRIWDWRLKASDTQVLNVNGPFVDGGPCPASVHGDKAVTDSSRIPHYPGINAVEVSGDGLGDDDGVCEAGEECQNRFLINALEVIDDKRGDNDGLCESSEACVYSPNIGYYQGEGDHRTRQCIFADGIVSGVNMYAYPNNGA